MMHMLAKGSEEHEAEEEEGKGWQSNFPKAVNIMIMIFVRET